MPEPSPIEPERSFEQENRSPSFSTAPLAVRRKLVSELSLQGSFVSGKASEISLSSLMQRAAPCYRNRPMTGLAPSENWEHVPQSVHSQETLRDLQFGVHVFDLPPKLVERAREAVTEESASGKFVPVPEQIVLDLEESLATVEDNQRYHLAPEAVALLSEADRVIGNTTDGLHFDPEGPLSLRVGLNVGDVTRRIHFVPTPKEVLSRATGRDFSDVQDYTALPELNLAVYGITVYPGQGWIMSTQRYLHDTNRLEPGTSKVLLFRPTLEPHE